MLHGNQTGCLMLDRGVFRMLWDHLACLIQGCEPGMGMTRFRMPGWYGLKIADPFASLVLSSREFA